MLPTQCLLIIAGLLSVMPLLAADHSKVHDAIRKGAITAAGIDTLTFDDVPDEWRARKSVTDTEAHTTVTFSRKGTKVLEVLWSKSWRDEKSAWFACTLFVDEKRVAIVRVRDAVSVLPESDTAGVSVITSLRDDKTLSVGMIRPDGSLVDSIMVKGRESCLMDDLEFTKGSLAAEMAVRPIMEAMSSGLREAVEERTASRPNRPNKAPEPTTTSVTSPAAQEPRQP
jgi:hypothetical protein